MMFADAQFGIQDLCRALIFSGANGQRLLHHFCNRCNMCVNSHEMEEVSTCRMSGRSSQYDRLVSDATERCCI